MTPEEAAYLAAELVDDLAGRSEADAAAFEQAYRLGVAAGIDIGYGRAHAELEAAWAAVARKVRAGGPTIAELNRAGRIPMVREGRERAG